MSKRITVFNHKGGVSKTTSAYNIGWMLAEKHKVLIVDADPQCNLTSLMLKDNFEKYYIDGKTKNENIKDGVEMAFTGKPYPIKAVECYSPERAPNLYLLAGHANLSEYDAALTFAQTSNNAITTLQNLPGAFSELIRLTEEKYSIEYTLIDLNPSLSAINQNLFLSSHSFVVPTNPDPFSIMTIDTLMNVLPRWVKWKKSAIQIFSDSAYPLPEGNPRFLGTLIQRFNIRNGKPARPYRDNIGDINRKISNEFYDRISLAEMGLESDYPKSVLDNSYCLSEIPDFQSLLPRAYDAGVPVFALTDKEIGEAGNVLWDMEKKRDDFLEKFKNLAKNLITMLDGIRYA
uniref:AAA domain-containing protein n=1 Tax=Candidatus Kentrum sp. FW TaxID=2126338 RepID=A0A450SCM7_9GAMM|nr:MAG: AAA domain-containing protein [Candidatus Kentron sp. FW]